MAAADADTECKSNVSLNILFEKLTNTWFQMLLFFSFEVGFVDRTFT